MFPFFYEVIEDLNLQDYRDGLEESNMDEAFAALKAQAKARQDMMFPFLS